MRWFILILLSTFAGCEVHANGTVQTLQTENATLKKQVDALSSQVQKLTQVVKNRGQREECIDGAETRYWRYIALNSSQQLLIVTLNGTAFAAPSDESTTRVLNEYREEGFEVAVRPKRRGEELPELLSGPLWRARNNVWEDARADKLVRLKECEIRFIPGEQEQEQPRLSAAR